MTAIPLSRALALLDHLGPNQPGNPGGRGNGAGPGPASPDPARPDPAQPRSARHAPGPARDRAARRLRALAVALDSSFTIPGINFKFGIDPLLGLIPGVGDAITTLLSLYIVFEGWRLGASREQLARMLANVAIDLAVGVIPVLGDLFDFAFRANLRNLRILGIQAAGVHVEFDPRAWGDR